MWKKVSEYSSQGIRAYSFRSKNDKLSNHYDIGIFFSTYESRGMISSQLLDKKSCRETLLILFEESKDHELRIKHDNILKEQLSKCSRSKVKIIQGKSIRNVELILDEIFSKISPKSFSQEAHWFIDIVGSPKPYFLGILGRLRQRAFTPQVTLFYSTADYKRGNSSEAAFSFTYGFDRYMWIPSFWGRPNPALPWTYLFLLGFEGTRSYEIYDNFEPKYVKSLIGKPGYKPEYVKIAENNNREFLRSAQPIRFYSNAADAVETWKILEENIVEDFKQSNICIVPLGSKPHALGGGLTALTSGIPSILYQMPRSFKVKDIQRGNYLWLYEITL